MTDTVDTDQVLDIFAALEEDEIEALPEDPAAPIREAFRPRNLFTGLLAGGVTGISSVTGVVALASLIYAGDLSTFLPVGVGFMLLGTVAISGVAALTSSIPGVIAGIQDTGIAVLSLVAAAIVASMPADASPQAAFVTVLAAIAIASTFTGIVFLAMGALRLGDLIRYVPYPVVGGFLGGTGLSLVRGGLSVMAKAPLAQAFVEPTLLGRWLPGLLFAMVLVVVLRRYNHYLIVPGMLLGSIGLFFLVLSIGGIPVSTAAANGWLLDSVPGGSLWQPIPLDDFLLIEWPVLFAQIGSLFSITVILVISLLLNASGIELETQQEMSLDRELKSMGVANLMAGLTGSAAGAHYLGSSVLVYHMGAQNRLSGVFNALASGVVLVAGGALLAFVPTPLLSGLLMFFGLSFIIKWVYEPWYELPKGEYAIVVLIVAVIFFRGFLEGVALGVVVSVILFVVNYSQINVIKHELSGVNHSSTVERHSLYRKLLLRKGHWLYMLKLQGFIFFGTANRLFRQFRARVEDPETQKPRYFLLDFKLVTGVDSSAMISFQRMLQLAKQHGIVLIFCHLPEKMRPRMERGVFAADRDEHWVAYSTLDRGMEWYEDRVIENFESVGLAARHPTMTRQLKSILPDESSVDRFMSYLEERELEADTVLIRQGDPPVGIYFVEEGMMRVELQLDAERTIRLRRMSSGTVIGELGTYLDVAATASVITQEESLLFFLSTDALERMEENDPVISSAFHRFMAHAIAERLASAAESMKVLLD